MFITIPSAFLRWNQCNFGFVCVIWCSKQGRIGLFVYICKLPWLLVGSRFVQLKSRDDLISHSMSKLENKFEMVSFLEMVVSNRMYAMCIFHRKIEKCWLYKCRQINVVIMKLKHYTLYNTSSIKPFDSVAWNCWNRAFRCQNLCITSVPYKFVVGSAKWKLQSYAQFSMLNSMLKPATWKFVFAAFLFDEGKNQNGTHSFSLFDLCVSFSTTSLTPFDGRKFHEKCKTYIPAYRFMFSAIWTAAAQNLYLPNKLT